MAFWPWFPAPRLRHIPGHVGKSRDHYGYLQVSRRKTTSQLKTLMLAKSCEVVQAQYPLGGRLLQILFESIARKSGLVCERIATIGRISW